MFCHLFLFKCSKSEVEDEKSASDKGGEDRADLRVRTCSAEEEPATGPPPASCELDPKPRARQPLDSPTTRGPGIFYKYHS